MVPSNIKTIPGAFPRVCPTKCCLTFVYRGREAAAKINSWWTPTATNSSYSHLLSTPHTFQCPNYNTQISTCVRQITAALHPWEHERHLGVCRAIYRQLLLSLVDLKVRWNHTEGSAYLWPTWENCITCNMSAYTVPGKSANTLSGLLNCNRDWGLWVE